LEGCSDFLRSFSFLNKRKKGKAINPTNAIVMLINNKLPMIIAVTAATANFSSLLTVFFILIYSMD
jgi:hypothetical protein